MELLKNALLGLVQGLTEFLPVSSSGHLVLAEAILGVGQSGLLLEVALHAATLLAVLAFYRERVLGIATGALRREREAFRDIAKLAVATIPAVVFALGARDFIETRFESLLSVGLGLLATGLILWSTRRTLPRATLEAPTFAIAWWMGCAQAAAILPGVSRSGATVCMALALGLRPLVAAEFSFLMSIAAITGAVVLQFSEIDASALPALLPLAVAFFVALVSGFAALALFVRLLRSQSFYRFAFYVWPVAAATIAFALYGSRIG